MAKLLRATQSESQASYSLEPIYQIGWPKIVAQLNGSRLSRAVGNTTQQAFALRCVMHYGHSFRMGWLQVMC